MIASGCHFSFFISSFIKFCRRNPIFHKAERNFVEEGEDYIELIRQYVAPFVQEGDILSISNTEILYLFLAFIAVIAFWYFTFNKLNVTSINTTLARSRGVNTKTIDNVFAVLIAIIVMISIRFIGILLINSLLILPAASSRNVARNMRTYHLFAVIFSLFSGITGLIISYYWNIPTGPMIVLISGLIYFITFGLKKKIKE